MIPAIQVRKLSAHNSYAGTLDFTYEPQEGLLEIPFVEFSTPVHAVLEFEILEDNSVEVKGNITFSLKGDCSRCLEPAEGTFTGEVFGVFVEGEGDGELYGYSNGTVDLEELMRDSLLFAFPMRLLCGNCDEPDNGES